MYICITGHFSCIKIIPTGKKKHVTKVAYVNSQSSTSGMFCLLFNEDCELGYYLMRFWICIWTLEYPMRPGETMAVTDAGHWRIFTSRLHSQRILTPRRHLWPCFNIWRFRRPL